MEICKYENIFKTEKMYSVKQVMNNIKFIEECYDLLQRIVGFTGSDTGTYIRLGSLSFPSSDEFYRYIQEPPLTSQSRIT
jgi:hypothetical protein